MGHAIEGLVAQHLRAWCDYSIGKHRLYYWRTRNNLEVDFVVYGEYGIFAFEVKNSSYIRTEDLTAMKAFQKDYPEAQCMVLYRGDVVKEVQGIECVPLEPFLKKLVPLSQETTDKAMRF